jgi:hypothetical protein
MATHFFNGLTAGERGKAIRLLVSKPELWVNRGIANAILPGKTIDNFPGVDEFRDLKLFIRQNASDRLTGLPNVSDEELGSVIVRAALPTPENQLALSEYSRLGEASKYVGFAKDEIEDAKKIEALENPTNYLKAKLIDKQRIHAISLRAYQDALLKYSSEYGYDRDTAEKKAKETAKAINHELMKQHKKEYPDEFGKIAEGKLARKN